MPLIVEPLPAAAMGVINRLSVPWPLLLHHYLIHDVAYDLCREFHRHWPNWRIDARAVLIGAATHDLGKTLHPGEMRLPGSRHLAAGERLLRVSGLSPELAQFARTHGAIHSEHLLIEDLLVMLADRSTNGHRNECLEEKLADRVVAETGCPRWDAIHGVGHLIDGIEERALARLRMDCRLAPPLPVEAG